MSNDKSLSFGENSLLGSKVNTMGVISRPKCTKFIYKSWKCRKVEYNSSINVTE